MSPQSESTRSLVVDGLTFCYRTRSTPALHDVSLAVERGELLLIAGSSGCGKTTLIRCINGLIPHSYKGELSGRITVNSQSIQGLPLSRISQMVGTVLQDPERQILGVRVATEVAFGLENLGMERGEILQRVDETLEFLHISHLRDRETFYLSGGEKQKVALAGVLAMRPNLLLLDEPLASLDPASAQESLALFRRLADEGVSIVLVEHRVEDVLTIHPDRVLFMENGAITYRGSADGLAEVVGYRQVKLPAPLVIDRAAGQPPPPILEPAIRPNGREPLVTFESVSFSYQEDGPMVLQDVDLTIHRGDVVALLGANGAGKTTLVKHAIGLLKPRQGRVWVEGHDTEKRSVAQIAHTLGYVFQSPSHMLFAPTVREELAFGPKNLGYDQEAIEEGVNQAVETVNLQGLEDFPSLALSFGQQKRVSIAAILAMRSRILVMDEPTAGQDYGNYLSFMDTILQMEGFEAVFFITHDVDLAVVYANRVILMHEGRVAGDGPPEEVLSNLDLIEHCRLTVTSLLKANLERLSKTGRFLPAEALAHVQKSG